jgi:phage terminase large subunit
MLKVSRPDISTTEIQDFMVHERFIKLPIDKYLELLGMTLNGPQIAILNAINNPKYRFVTAAVSRRVGKTTIANVIAQVISLVPGCAVLIMSPNYSLSSISFEEQRKLIKKFDLEVVRDNAKDRVIELSNGSSIRMGSVSQVDSVVGRSYDLILFDEAALTAEGKEAFEVALRPTLDKPNSKAIFISTPRGRLNWFSQYWQNGFSDLPAYSKWASVHADYRANPRANEEDIEEARATMSKAKFEQEYMASFSVFENQVYKFDADASAVEVDTSGMEHIMGIDVGFRDPTAMLVLAFDGEKFYAVDEYLEANRTTDEHAAVCKELERKYDVQVIFIDSAAQQTRFDWAQNHDISTTNATKSVLDGIAYVQAIVEQGKLVVSPKCKHTLAALDQYRWDPSPSLLREKPLHDQFSHVADALRYALYSYRSNVGIY